MPLITTLLHATLQIIIVGLGSPLGRELAPREAAAALAAQYNRWLNFNEADQWMILACAAGAGLAAVYNVPLAVAIFTLETLLFVWTWQTLLAALLSSGVAVVVRLGVGDVVQYPLPMSLPNEALIYWAPLMGALDCVLYYGVCAYWLIGNALS